MESSYEIARLCESWWGRLADSAKEDQNRFGEQLLELLGWRGAVPIDPKTHLAQFLSASYVLRGRAQTAVAAHFVMPGSLEPPGSLLTRGLDFCEVTRLLANETRMMNVDYAYITDLYRSYLYDARADELLLHADTPREFRRDFIEVLTPGDIERGALDEVRRQPRSHVARQFREWCHRWQETFVAEARASEETAQAVLDRLLVLRYLFDRDILKRTGWQLRTRFSELVAKAFGRDPTGCGKGLTSLFHDLWLDWKADLFAADPAVDAVLECDRFAAPLLKEFALHSRGKFGLATILESFNYGDAAEKARVRMVPDENEEREQYLAKQTAETIDDIHIELDLADEGYRAIFHWLDKLVTVYERIEIEFDLRQIKQAAPADEMDLFAWSEMAARRPKALGDKLQHAVEHGLTVYCSTPRQWRTARIMLYLHIIASYHKSKQRFVQFPKTDNIFQERPRVLDADRKRIYERPTVLSEHWEE